MTFWKKLFGGQEDEPALDPFTDLVLEKMRPGYLVDYELRTWEVTARHHADLGDGLRMDSWEIRAEGEVRYLSRIEADGTFWTLTRKVPIGMVDSKLRSYIQDNGDPPQQIDFSGVSYALDSYGGAKFFRNGHGAPIPFLYWDYKDESGSRLLSIEQWGDIDFEAYVGGNVEEYQFSNILPRSRP